MVYINPKMANGFRFFLVNKNISSCQVVTSLGQLRVLRSVSCGLGDLRDVEGSQGFFTSAAAGLRSQHSALITQVNISGDGESGRLFTWCKKQLKDPPPQKKQEETTHNSKPTSIFLLSILINNNHKLQIHYQPELPGWTTLDLRHWLVWSSWQWSWDA